MVKLNNKKEKRYWLITSWRWWRNNHGYGFWLALWLTLRSDIWHHIDEVYSWLWLCTIGRWKMKKLKAIEKYLEATLKQDCQ
jgi:hypothetical protein